tara:strand:+ start:828 stop:1280 length:453 start_codon:yes stop_codon:yes gene_type:complete
MSYADEFARLEEFLQADPDYARFDAECNRLQKIVDEQSQVAHSASCDYEAWSLCESTLEFAALDVPAFKPDNLALYNDELAAQQLSAGAKVFERRKRACLVKAGEASRNWAEASDQLEEAQEGRQKRRYALVDVWREIEANKKPADHEAK